MQRWWSQESISGSSIARSFGYWSVLIRWRVNYCREAVRSLLRAARSTPHRSGPQQR
jgi:hypothetical protein